MGRSAERIEIVTWVEPSEHEADRRFLEELKFRVRHTVEDVQREFPRYFIDTMGLD